MDFQDSQQRKSTNRREHKKTTKNAREKKPKAKEDNCNAELEVKVRRRVALEEKAFRVVEKLVDETISEETLSNLAQCIEPSHYSDITEERFLADMCGYPVCSKPIGKVLTQKYHISTKSNSVYDITDRKKFCSNQCYKASKHFAAQISSSPVWIREEEKPVNFSFLSLDDSNKGSAGEIVILSPAHDIARDLAELNEIDSRNERSKARLEKVLKNTKPSEKEENVTIEDVVDQLSNVYIDMKNEGEKADRAADASTNDITDSTPTSTVLHPGVQSLNESIVKEQNISVQNNPATSDNAQQSSLNLPHVECLARTEAESDRPGSQSVEATENSGNLNTHENKEAEVIAKTSESVDANKSNMYQQDYRFDHTKRRELYGYDHVQQINKAEVGKEIVQNDLQPGDADILPRESVYKRSKRDSKLSNSDYGFDFQAREEVYGLDHQQQILKMQTNKEMLLKELQQTSPVCNEGSESASLPKLKISQIPKVDGTMAGDLNSDQVKKVKEKVEAKGNLLLQLLDKRDNLKRIELNEEQNVALETGNIVQKENSSKSERYSDTLQNAERAAKQQHVFQTDQSNETAVSDSDDDADDVIETSTGKSKTNQSNEPIQSDPNSTENQSMAAQYDSSNVQESPMKHTVKLTPFMLVNKILFEWKTVDSVKCLKEEKGKGKRTQSDFEEKYAALGRRLDRNLKESSDIIGGEIDSDDDWGTPSGKLPEMDMLKQQGSEYSVRAREFLDPSSDIEQAKQEANASQKNNSQHDVTPVNDVQHIVEEDAKSRRFRKKNFPMKDGTEGAFNRSEFVTEPEIVLPYVDSNAQISIRRKIVLDKLSKALPDLLRPLRLTLSDIGHALRGLVNTFNLTSSNVTLRPAEWTLMGILILKILATKNDQISTGFELISARTYFDRLLETVGISDGQVNHIVRKFAS